MADSKRMRGQLRALADHLARRREALLDAWRLATDIDPEVTSAAASTRNQFVDHIAGEDDNVDRFARLNTLGDIDAAGRLGHDGLIQNLAAIRREFRQQLAGRHRR